ncbi:hypothetical protein MZM54_02290 [[Brevibacterium] frigoritolerans]|nr:hypothetical protein [Peribacillus frigoritolerans]
MFSIEELGLDYYLPLESQEEYKRVAYSSEPLEKRIVELLTLNPGFMKRITSEEETYKSLKYNSSVELIKQKVSENKKLEFFALSFNVKPHIKEITNGLIYPDVSDFLTLLHLNVLFKYINEIYEPGSSIRIGCQFSYFRKFNGITPEEALEMHNNLNTFNHIAERMTQSNDHYVQLFNIYNEVDAIKKDFYLKVEAEKFKILQDDINMSSIRMGADYYMNYVVDVSQFPNKEAAWNFCMYHTLDSAAYKSAVLTMFNTSSGFFERFTELIKCETRFQLGSNLREVSDAVYIAFLPGASTFSFNRLTVKHSLGLWELATHKEISEYKAKEFFVNELNYPFFFAVNENG